MATVHINQAGYLKIIALNINSLVSHCKRISLLNMLKSLNPHFLCLSETKLSSRHKPTFDSYNFTRNDRDGNRVGTGILVKSTIKADSTSIPNLRCSEATAVTIHLSNSEKLLIVSVYFRGNSNVPDTSHDLHLLNQISAQHEHSIICGDFNARHHMWNDSTTNRNGININNWLESNSQIHNLVVISQRLPTFPRSGSFLDFYLVSASLLNQFPGQENFLCRAIPAESDHLAVELKIKLNPHLNFLEIDERKFISFANTNWHDLSNYTSNRLEALTIHTDRNLSNQEIDHLIESFTNVISEAVERFTEKASHKNYKYKNLPWPLQQLYKRRQKMRKALNRIYNRFLNNTNSSYISLRSQINCLSIIIRNQTQNFVNQQFDDRLKAIRPNGDMFKEINKLANRKQPIPTKVLINNEVVSNTQDISNHLAAHFSNQFTLNPIDLQFKANVDTEVDRFLESQKSRTSDSFEPITTFSNENPSSSPNSSRTSIFITPNYVEYLIKTGNNKKSSGPDNVSSFVLKRLPAISFIFLTVIFNNCLNNGYFPKKWKIAKIFPIAKKNNAVNISDFRPIALISVIGKKLETIIKDAILDHSNQNELIPHNQFGFREGNSTFHALLKFRTDIAENLNEDRFTASCFLDISKAFDKVWINGLIFKLIRFRFPHEIIRLVFDFMSNREFYVDICGFISSLCETQAGVPQGSVLGPILFNLFTSDQPLEDAHCTTLLYADDSVTYASAHNPNYALLWLKRTLDRLVNYYNKWGLKINYDKTELIIFRKPSSALRGNHSSACRRASLHLGGNEIKPKDSVRYLGVRFQKLLKFTDHANIILKKANMAYGLISPLFRRNSGLSPKVKLLLYKQLIRPIIAYAFPIFFTINKTALSRLLTLERKILRAVTAKNYKTRLKKYSNEEIYEATRNIGTFEPLDVFLLQQAKKTMEKCVTHNNPLINSISRDNREADAANEYRSPFCILHYGGPSLADNN